MTFTTKKSGFVWVMALVLGVWFAFGCASTRAYEGMLENWVGKPVDTLTKHWGAPSNIELLGDSNHVYQYVRYDQASENRGTASAEISCQTNFIINQGNVVVGWTHLGYDCRTK
jgi:hypothetical protein